MVLKKVGGVKGQCLVHIGVAGKHLRVACNNDEFCLRVLLFDDPAHCGSHNALAYTAIYLENDVNCLIVFYF